MSLPLEYAIETQNLTRRFGSFVAVDEVTLKIPKGQLYGFLGLNGAGKTTTIRMLTTLLPASAGSAKLWGHDVSNEPLAVRALIGLVSDETSESQSTWTAREYLGYFARIRHMPDPAGIVEHLLDKVGFGMKFRDKIVGTYSTGMKRRVEIARALMGSPKVLFLVEPTRGLDLPAKREMWNLLRDLVLLGRVRLDLYPPNPVDRTALADGRNRRTKRYCSRPVPVYQPRSLHLVNLQFSECPAVRGA